eukprot:TRINITY_DN12082_c0_g1_i1.p1 TRINITY_DN12082_c0_g1~~TRINITY_DN12082_c0_g1_i1.p1  ORF type:complete len:384 (-),score=76.90 TRINITY_DN12082_c0_g1_i1:298-1449(-)
MSATPIILMLQIKEARESVSNALDLSKQMDIQPDLSTLCNQATGCLLSSVLILEQTEKILKSVLESSGESIEPIRITNTSSIEDEDMEQVNDGDDLQNLKLRLKRKRKEKKTAKKKARLEASDDTGGDQGHQEVDRPAEYSSPTKNDHFDLENFEEFECRDDMDVKKEPEHITVKAEVIEQEEEYEEALFDETPNYEVNPFEGMDPDITQDLNDSTVPPERKRPQKLKMCRSDCPNCSIESCRDFINCRECFSKRRCPKRKCLEYDRMLKRKNPRKNSENCCYLCGRPFSEYKNLKKHMKKCSPLHTNRVLPFKCLVCAEHNLDITYDTFGEYRAHAKEAGHEGQQPLKKCAACSKFIPQKKYLAHVNLCIHFEKKAKEKLNK